MKTTQKQQWTGEIPEQEHCAARKKDPRPSSIWCGQRHDSTLQHWTQTWIIAVSDPKSCYMTHYIPSKLAPEEMQMHPNQFYCKPHAVLKHCCSRRTRPSCLFQQPMLPTNVGTAGQHSRKQIIVIFRVSSNISYIIFVIKCLRKSFLDFVWCRKHQEGQSCQILASLSRWMQDVDPPVWRPPSIYWKLFRRRTDIWEVSPAAWRQMPNKRTSRSALSSLTACSCK